MPWEKRGVIFAPQQQRGWIVSHAALPIALHETGSIYRVYFCSRDEKGRASIGYFTVDLAAPQTVLSISDDPVIGLGPLGAFDDNGVTSSCITVHEDRLYQYYTGWHLGVTVPFYFFCGLAISEDGGLTFHRASPSPVLGRNRHDPFLTASPWVLKEGSRWRMWYISCDHWEMVDEQPRHYYHVRYAESTDGISWQPTGWVCLDFASAEEYAFARPCVIKDSRLYKMWYSVRGGSYRIGYAESEDGLTWVRQDEAVGIDVSETGWDAEMIEYPYVFDHEGTRYMLYNGNGYGRTGIGLAVWR